MNGAKPIEAGCMAVVIRSGEQPEWVGIVVTVISRGSPWRPNENYWKINIPTKSNDCYCLERGLLRLDDPDIQHQIEQETKIPVFVEAMKRVRQKGSCIPKSNTAAVPEA